MVRWEEDPVYQAIAQAFMSGDLEMHAGGPLDVRAVMASISQETKDAFAYDHLPWERSPAAPRPEAMWRTCAPATPTWCAGRCAA